MFAGPAVYDWILKVSCTRVGDEPQACRIGGISEVKQSTAFIRAKTTADFALHIIDIGCPLRTSAFSHVHSERESFTAMLSWDAVLKCCALMSLGAGPASFGCDDAGRTAFHLAIDQMFAVYLGSDSFTCSLSFAECHDNLAGVQSYLLSTYAAARFDATACLETDSRQHKRYTSGITPSKTDVYASELKTIGFHCDIAFRKSNFHLLLDFSVTRDPIETAAGFRFSPCHNDVCNPPAMLSDPLSSNVSLNLAYPPCASPLLRSPPVVTRKRGWMYPNVVDDNEDNGTGCEDEGKDEVEDDEESCDDIDVDTCCSEKKRCRVDMEE